MKQAARLDRVAAIYREAAAAKSPPGTAIAAEFGVTAGRASQFVKAARAAGLLEDVVVPCDECGQVTAPDVRRVRPNSTYSLCEECRPGFKAAVLAEGPRPGPRTLRVGLVGLIPADEVDGMIRETVVTECKAAGLELREIVSTTLLGDNYWAVKLYAD